MRHFLPYLILLDLLIYHPGYVIAQGRTPLTIGDVCPDVSFTFVNYAETRAKLSDFKGKAVLLDFWGTWCGPCVASLPAMDGLEKKFGDSLMVIPVTSESEKIVQSALTKIENVTGVKVPSAVTDTILNSIFPHKTVPYYVWIDANGVIKAFTYPEAITEANIRDLIGGRRLNVSVRNEYANNTYAEGTLFTLLNGRNTVGGIIINDSSIETCRMLTKFSPSSIEGFGWPGGCINMSNVSIMNLFQVAYGEGVKYFGGWKRVQLLTNDSSQFTDYRDGQYNGEYKSEWRKVPGHEYNYVLKLPEADSVTKWEMMRSDLATYFPFVSAKITHRIDNCLVLYQTGKTHSFMSVDTGKFMIQKSPYFLVCNRAPMNSFLMTLKMLNQNSVIVDETGYGGDVDIHIEAPMHDIAAVNKQLFKYGLVVKEENRDIDVLTISDLRSSPRATVEGASYK
jgi:thiol-disulfide isomerase/thioredoxin